MRAAAALCLALLARLLGPALSGALNATLDEGAHEHSWISLRPASRPWMPNWR